ncbi:ATP synthase subunit b, mitochondrial [Diaphorina citri]|uniref:ATP synthase subunit b n=1 Tax=Diaphorina citri TaxID=121845 RepID=A0A3Q0JDM5_DIACI|nr:ATP synthase subunit b, mitochondrial [Diaphorina citri]
MAKCAQVMNRSVVLTWVMYQSHRAGKIRTNDKLASLKGAIENELWNQERSKAQAVLYEAKRENIQMQLEAVFRERALFAYQQVKNRLEYQAALESIQRRISQKHMVSWVVSHVLKSITPDQDKQSIKKCISDLKALAARA